MSRTKNIELYRKKSKTITKNSLNSTIRSQLDASKKYDEKFDIIKIRVPSGCKKQLKDIARNNNTSVNALIWELLKEKFDL